MDKNAGVFIINAMRAIAGKEWRAERESLRSLDRIQYRARRIWLAATKTISVNAL